MEGHFTLRVDPLASKKLLVDHGFYYCDTLLEPFARQNSFISFHHDSMEISTTVPLSDLLEICDGAFAYGRFHRDFNLNPIAADERYNNWLSQLYEESTVFALLHERQVAGFFACIGGKIVLHALADDFKGKGLAKYFWSRACTELFKNGHPELSSSVSAANLAVMNLYISLGFRFRNPCEVYHKYNPSIITHT